jgi:flagellar motor switch protein FliN/FliY
MTRDEALLKLGESTVEATAGVLETFAPGAVEIGTVTVLEPGAAPLDTVDLPTVAASVAYVDGVKGGNVFVFTGKGAKLLAAAMMGADAPEEGDELSELELSAVGEAMNQMMAAAAAGTGSALGKEVEISTPTTAVLATAEEAAELCEDAPNVTSVAMTVLGEPARLIQLVPNAFVVRMTRALDDLAAQMRGASDVPTEGHVPEESMRHVPVRVWAELGRTRLPIGRAVGLAPGTVVELDQAPDDPVDLFVSGRRFARGSLVLVDGEWAIQVSEILPTSDPVAMVAEGESD